VRSMSANAIEDPPSIELNIHKSLPEISSVKVSLQGEVGSSASSGLDNPLVALDQISVCSLPHITKRMEISKMKQKRKAQSDNPNFLSKWPSPYIAHKKKVPQKGKRKPQMDHIKDETSLAPEVRTGSSPAVSAEVEGHAKLIKIPVLPLIQNPLRNCRSRNHHGIAKLSSRKVKKEVFPATSKTEEKGVMHGMQTRSSESTSAQEGGKEKQLTEFERALLRMEGKTSRSSSGLSVNRASSLSESRSVDPLYDSVHINRKRSLTTTAISAIVSRLGAEMSSSATNTTVEGRDRSEHMAISEAAFASVAHTHQSKLRENNPGLFIGSTFSKSSQIEVPIETTRSFEMDHIDYGTSIEVIPNDKYDYAKDNMPLFEYLLKKAEAQDNGRSEDNEVLEKNKINLSEKNNMNFDTDSNSAAVTCNLPNHKDDKDLSEGSRAPLLHHDAYHHDSFNMIITTMVASHYAPSEDERSQNYSDDDFEEDFENDAGELDNEADKERVWYY